ncbi:MAG: alpha/beta fold hydrolase [Raoultibacter sp.]
MAAQSKVLGILAALGAGAATFAGAMLLLGNTCVKFALIPGSDGKTGRMREPDRIGGDLANGAVSEAMCDVVLENRAALQADTSAWLASVDAERVTIMSSDDLYDLVGYVYPATIPSSKWAVIVHGYTGDHTEMEHFGAQYAAQGYNVFIPDLRAQGESGGSIIGMGWTDRLDLICWLEYLVDRFGGDISIVMHGHSMGGAAVCMASGEQLPPHVKAIVSDCAFTSVWDMFSSQLKNYNVAAPYPLLEGARIALKARNSYDIKHASALEQVKKSTTPTLFLHGSDDGFVPLRMVDELFAACAAPEKRMLVVAGAGHALSEQTDPILYFSTVFNFLESVLSD